METNFWGTVSYNTLDNHLITAVPDFSSYVPRNRSVSAVSKGGRDQDSAYKAGGTINTEYINNWRSLLNSDKKKVVAKRKGQGVKIGNGKGSQTGNELDKLKELKEKNSKIKRKTKALKKEVTNDNVEGDDNDKPEDYVENFGGKQSKNKSKKN